MNLYQRFMDRFSVPGEDETVRSRRILGSAVLFVASASTLVNALRYLSQGINQVAEVYLFLAGGLLLLLVVGLVLPRQFVRIAFIAILFSMACSLAAHIAAGGYTTGLLVIEWMLPAVAFAVLFTARREAFILIAVYVVMITAAGLLEPRIAPRALDLQPIFVARDSTVNMLLMGLLITGASLYMFGEMERYRRRADNLLLNILPGSIAGRLKVDPGTIADGHGDVTVLFADIVDFTDMSAGADPVDVVRKLNTIFSEFDLLAAQYGLEKIKTIGDAYMVASGLPEPRTDHCAAMADFALEIVAAMEHHESWDGRPIQIRVGMNTGPVVAGVIGRQKFIYDLWGDAVNVASRMESGGLANTIQVTQAVRDRLDGRYEFEVRGPILVKGKGEMVTYILQGKAASAANPLEATSAVGG